MITKEQFGLWKHLPVTLFFFQFLRDKSEFMLKTSSEQWLDGSKSFGDFNQSVRGQIIELIEVMATEYEFIQAFYEEMNESRTESNS